MCWPLPLFYNSNVSLFLVTLLLLLATTFVLLSTMKTKSVQSQSASYLELSKAFESVVPDLQGGIRDTVYL